ncbi:hypothetical protein [Actinomadura bangladeshensis]|uniref:Uncharacterized protein n=1 Tax=Actinomadura bangladeshensis TaxID=453573 RepID=A0A6L9QJB8_9ACTN|nr:hypothetical protein [Actinomadura bangladeshensis]NEA25537.1 hypothetical protein [Actinomadura bangladeshensis]
MRLRILAVLPLALALTLTGCGSDGGDDPGVASAGGARQSGAAGGQKPDQGDMGVKFAQCMREHGVQMDDPKPGQGVQIKAKGDKESMDKAMEACRQYNPMESATGAPDPKMEERAREHAECMRKNGVEEFPDPKRGQRGIRIDQKVGEDPDFQAAQEKCQKILQGGK